MKAIDKLKEAISEYENETKTIINNIEIIERITYAVKESQGNNTLEFKIKLETESL